MKSIAAVTVLILLIFSSANAMPVYMSFDGTITRMSDDAKIFETYYPGIKTGDLLQCIFYVDFGADGFVKYPDGSVEKKVDTAGTDYFYAQYISGTISPWHNNLIGTNYGENLIFGEEGSLFASGIRIESWGAQPIEWVPNVGNLIAQFKFTDGGYESFIGSTDFRLSDITPAPVPEPSTIILLGSAIFAFSAKRKFSKIKKSLLTCTHRTGSRHVGSGMLHL